MQASHRELDSIFVGMIRLAGASDALETLQAGLSVPDRERAGRFRRAEDRARFVLGRCVLRTMLREHLDYPAGPLEFAFTERGRPYLAASPTIAFSISHAGDIVAVALTTGSRVGLDVESVDRRIDLGPLAERILDASDLARFLALPVDTQPGAFFHAWTGKEAVLKARGVGLFGGVETISVPLDGSAATVQDVEEGRATAWQLEPLPVPAGYLGAVAWDDPNKAVRVREFTLPCLEEILSS
jgi:4'-phosphopantetheinyl transferase